MPQVLSIPAAERQSAQKFCKFVFCFKQLGRIVSFSIFKVVFQVIRKIERIRALTFWQSVPEPGLSLVLVAFKICATASCTGRSFLIVASEILSPLYHLILSCLFLSLCCFENMQHKYSRTSNTDKLSCQCEKIYRPHVEVALIKTVSEWCVCVLLCCINPRVRKIRNEASSNPGIYSRTLCFCYNTSSKFPLFTPPPSS